MKKIHTCLVSEQTIPNILAIETFDPDELLLISTREMEEKGKSRHILECLKFRGFDYSDRHHLLIVAEDSFLDCRLKLEKWIQGREVSDFVVNLTGGTKIMSIAAYEFFKEYGSRMIYIPIPRNEYITVFPPHGTQQTTMLPQRLLVSEYLKAYGLTALNMSHTDSLAQEARKHVELSAWIVTNYDSLKNLLNAFRLTLRKHRGVRMLAFKDSYDVTNGSERRLLSRMDFKVTGHDLEKQLPKAEIHFLTGGWLEEYCYNEISSFLGQGIVDAVMGVEVKNAAGTSNEFDVMFTKDNALYTVECKSLDQEQDQDTDILYKIGALQKDFGLRVRSFLVSTSQNILKNGKVKSLLSARAEHLNTKIIPPHDVLHFKKILSENLKLQE